MRTFALPLAAILGALCLTKLANAQGSMSSTDSTVTPADSLITAILATNQTEGVPDDAWPAQPVDATEVATNTSSVIARRAMINKGNIALQRRAPTPVGSATSPSGTAYQIISDGQDASNQYATAAVQMPAYLTYTVVTNATDASGNWNFAAARDACLKFCDRTPSCVTANLYKEYNNPLLDYTFSEKSNAKCALFGDVPELDQITNKGGQQLKKAPEPLTRIDSASVFTVPSRLDANPTVPGYTQTYGPINAANNDPGYMTYKLLTKNDPVACSKICDQTSGCVAFNTWRGVVNGDPRTYTCSLYRNYIDASTAKNFGDDVNKVKVTYSRGYVKSAVAAVQQCQINNGMQGFDWQYYSRPYANPPIVCEYDDDIPSLSGLPLKASSTAKGQDLALNSGRGDTFQPYGSTASVDSDYFSMVYTTYFAAPADGTYTLALTNGDDVVRAWSGDVAKSGWQSTAAEMTTRCNSMKGDKTVTMKKGDYLPIRVVATNGYRPGSFTYTIKDSAGNTMDKAQFVRGSCDGSVAPFA